ncbi:uncharacterized protein F4822DRAFT_433342 [Hypoxylon trugodes]|uniref:uncharacterized protein n=1 Tax=Hypoxylon trugodes TaxID=326681 RepID=UPI0021927CAD|nr:uncharacterized protein F4822DRAFT_433342 [Hypoxylon trugodes]KAI1384802.1 hypothetical protein F4822DRAFT_433342 [Hypoxylon trugodes]
MADPRPLSEAETRFFNQVCEAIHATNEDQRTLLKSFIRDDIATEWTHLVELMGSNGSLIVLSEDELKYLNTSYSASRGHQRTESHDEASMLLSQKTTDPKLVKAATQDIIQYNDVLEKLVSKYKDYVHRSAVNAQPSAARNGEASVVEQKIAALSRRKEQLKAEIHILEDKIGNQNGQLGRSQPSTTPGSNYDDVKSIALKQVFETTFPSYDHILSRLDALQGELGQNVNDDTTLQIARRHASQIILSMATKCRASLDMVFLEASSTYNKRTPNSSNHAQAINEERDAIYAEIQSLWDEMVPLAHMVVEKEFLKPVLKKVDTSFERQNVRDTIVFGYTSAMLRFMNERLRLLANRIEMLMYHHRSLLIAFTYVNSIKESKSTRGLGTINAHPPQSAENGRAKDRSLLDMIQRQMELYGSIPIDTGKQAKAGRTLTSHAQVSKFDRYVASRQRKGDDLARSVQKSFEVTAKAELTDAELGSQLLLDSVVADSAASAHLGGHVYEDQQVEDLVASMKSQAEEIQRISTELREGASAPLSAPDFVAFAYSKAVKQPAYKDGEDNSRAEDPEQCPKLTAIASKWDDTAAFTN